MSSDAEQKKDNNRKLRTLMPKDDVEMSQPMEPSGPFSRREEEDLVPKHKILYASRTHVQLTQAMKELKKTPYKDRPSLILGSRDQLCIHHEVKDIGSISAKNQACKIKVKQRTCRFYDRFEEKSKILKNQPIIDLEDLVTTGLKHSFCPYYASRLFKKRSEVIFTPYNYLLVPSLRRSQQLDLQGSVVIFDEGHNLESICEESASSEISSVTLASVVKELDRLLVIVAKMQFDENKQVDPEEEESQHDMDEEMMIALDPKSLVFLKNILCDFIEALDEVFKREMDKKKKNQPSRNTFNRKEEEEFQYRISCSFMFDEVIDRKLYLDEANVSKLMNIIDQISLLLSTSTQSSSGPFSSAGKVTQFESLKDFFKVLFPDKDPTQVKPKITPLDIDIDEIGNDVDTQIFRKQFSEKFKIVLEKIDPNKLYNANNHEEQTVQDSNGGKWYVSNTQKFKRFKSEDDAEAEGEKGPTDAWRLNLFCLSPSVAIQKLIDLGTESIIVTSGTLAPIESFSASMEIPFPILLENKHVILSDQLIIRALCNSSE